MHAESKHYIQSVRDRFPDFFRDVRVLEAGSLDINGSVRQFFINCAYTGIDIGEGQGVDKVISAHEHKDEKLYDTVITSEMLEHDSNYKESLLNLYNNLEPGGLLIITCAGPTRPEHGTTRTDTYSSPYTTDYYRNISVEDIFELLPSAFFNHYELDYGRGGEDLYFSGIKVGGKELTKGAESILINERPKVTVCIPTKNRYDVLHLCLLSLAMQTYKPNNIVVVDDTDMPMDVRTDPNYVYVLQLLNEYGIGWEFKFGKKKGQHHSHQMVQDTAIGDLVFRIDDDEIAEPDVLEILVKAMADPNVGAVAPAVLMPNPSPLPQGLNNTVTWEMDTPNIQWFKWAGVIECEHLYSCFLYRKGINNYNLELSTVCHREETFFTHGIYRKGFKLLALGHARVWHFRGESGGIRTFRDPALWEHDEALFKVKLKQWGIEPQSKKVIVLDNGLGDHFAFKNIIPELKSRYKELTIACCFPDAFFDMPELKLISIAEAKLIYSNLDSFHIYKWMWENKWETSLVDAFHTMYL